MALPAGSPDRMPTRSNTETANLLLMFDWMNQPGNGCWLGLYA
jgi:hypothetical protein